MVADASSRLERIDDARAGPLLVTASGLLAFGENGPARTSRHVQPAWKLVVALDGELLVPVPGRLPCAAPGLLVPPNVAHAMAATGAYRCLQVDPWVEDLFAVDRPVALPGGLSDRLGAALAAPTSDDLPAVAVEVLARLRASVPLPPRPAAQPRVRAAAARAGTTGSLSELAAEVGLSPVRLRQLVGAELGVTLAHLRRWQRLRASAALPGTTLAQRAVDAGFSDQAHFTRTARRLVGRTPGDLVGSRLSRKA